MSQQNRRWRYCRGTNEPFLSASFIMSPAEFIRAATKVRFTRLGLQRVAGSASTPTWECRQTAPQADFAGPRRVAVSLAGMSLAMWMHLPAALIRYCVIAGFWAGRVFYTALVDFSPSATVRCRRCMIG